MTTGGRQRFEPLFSLKCLRAPRVAGNDLTPGPALVVKLLCLTIKNKSDSLTVVAIEPTIIEKITKLRGDASLREIKSADRFARESRRRILSCLAVQQQHLRSQR